MGWGDLVLEVYKDLVQPTSRDVGGDLQALYRNRLKRLRKRLIGKVPEKRRIKAHPQIAIPVLQELRYADEDGPIAEMFLNLLARAIDKERVDEAHPAFVQIIKHLSPDEAVILFYLKTNPIRHVLVVNATFPHQSRIENSELPANDLIFPKNLSVYFEHLENLSLVKTGIDHVPSSTPVEDKDGSLLYQTQRLYMLTEFGQMFAKACIPDELPSNVNEPSKTF